MMVSETKDSKGCLLMASLTIWMLLLTLFPLRAEVSGGAPGYTPAAGETDSLRVSIVTCWPGPEIYELAGHEAIRVVGPGFDYVWNYGTFDFDQPNFIGRFVSGQTDYMVQAYPFAWFLPEYKARGSKVVEQELLLTPAEKAKLFENLKRNARPENATYRYNYVKDNCATRITAMLDTTLDRRILFPDTIRHGTFRKVMRAYHHDYPWYQFGIDLVLGSGLDHKISRREEMFAPLEMESAYASARFADGGGPVAAPAVVLYEGKEDATLGPTPWYLTPFAASAVALLISVGTILLWWRRNALARWWYSLYFGLCGLGGCLVAYLVFFSAHEATSPNLLLVWLNPLQLILALGVWWRSWRYPTSAVALYNAVALPVLLLIWPSQQQSGSAPIFIFMLSAILLSVLYIIIVLKKSYYNDMVHPSDKWEPGFLRSPSAKGGKKPVTSKTRKTTASTRGRKK